MDLKEEALLAGGAGEHWYYRAKLAALVGALDGRAGAVLDVGAGSGFFARALLARGVAARAVCVDTGYAAEWDEVVAGRALAFRRALPAGVGEGLGETGTVLLMDVLEHVADDLALLRSAVAGAVAGSRVVVTVPAFQWLWSGHDVYLGHHRRYTLGGVERLLRQAGLRVERAHYLYGLVLPLAVGQRLAMRGVAGRGVAGRGGVARSAMRPFGRVANGVLAGVCGFEQRWARHNRLAGLSVLARAVVPG